jgi:hypothetical protein
MKLKTLTKKNKRGAVTDLFVWMIVCFVIVIVLGAFYYMGGIVNTKITEKIPVIQASMGSEEKTNVTQIVDESIGELNRSFEAFKWISVMLMVGMLLSLVLSGFLVKIHPAFFIANLFLIVIAIAVSIPLSNTYEKLYLDATLGATFTGFYGASYIWLNLPMWVVVAGFLSLIVSFVSMSRGDSLGGTY